MEELILHYYLKVFSVIFIFLLLFCFLYIFYILNKNVILKDNFFEVNKGDKFEKVLRRNIVNISEFDIFILNQFYKTSNIFLNKFIHFGSFYLKDNSSSIELFKLVTKSSNVFNKITIIEGWSKKDLDTELSKHFINFNNINYQDVIADTYYFEGNKNFNYFYENLKKYKKEYFEKYKDNQIYKMFSQNEILTIGSLVEKEGLGSDDKRIISSVILNRLKKKMKLQIDATVLFALTNGEYNLDRKLLLSDLKIDHPYNTYQNYGLPPQPISYVGKKTLDIIFENYKTDFLFYFFNYSLNRHIFSKTFEEHKNKLNEYRNSK